MSTSLGARVGEAVTPPPPATGGTFPVLDTLRAVGALCVVTTHAAFWAGEYTGNGVWGTLLARLDVGVAIFFVLSGFLLARPWLIRAADGTTRPAVRPYLRKRFLRIAPLYVVTVVLALSLVQENRDLGVADWLRTLLMLDTATGQVFPAGLTQMWSLAVEVAFYLVLPLVMLLAVGRGRPLRVPRVLLCLAALGAVSVYWHLDAVPRLEAVIDGAPVQWLPAYLSWFAVGLLLALVQVLHERGTAPRWAATIVALGRQPGSCWVLAVALLLVCATPLAGPSMFDAPSPAEALAKNVLYAAIGFLVVVTGVFTVSGGRYAQTLSHLAARRLGWISYGIFCLHLPVLHLVMWSTGWPLFQGRGLQIWLLTVLISVAAAEVAYRVVERPALRLKMPRRQIRPSASETTSPTTETTSR
ncbi:acyltransferase family protein [Nocardioides pantholopis]|uniref:acyltransferase family protein n=1 Tax=Nocardioides pantholopis TaxID=2483798 RepID=UPI0013E3D7D9|nr:acyltransferase [Nocardioides pantholopis]